ncbi:MAG: AtpZ/AtpI family protein [bacterium]|nr:AtpZ/AtpI family protein [bacterium]
MNQPDLNPGNTEKSEKNTKALFNFATLAGMVGELGFIIAVPLLVTIVAGIWVDKKLATTPLFMIVGILLAITVSTITIGRKIKQLNKINGI